MSPRFVGCPGEAAIVKLRRRHAAPGMVPLGEAASAPPPSGDIRAVLRIRPFRWLWISLSLSSLGDWLGFLATTALARQLVGSYSAQLYAIGGVLFVRLLPALVIGPVAGAFADRFNRRTTMVVTDLVRFGLFVSIPIVKSLVWLLIASFLIECASLFWIPAKEASIPNLVPRERLEAANQLNLVTTYGFGAVAAGLFSVLAFVNRVLAHEFSFFRTNPTNLALYIDAITFAVSALTVAGLHEISSARPSGSGEAGEQIGVVRSIAEGVRFLAAERWLRGLVIGISGATAAGAAVIGLSPVFAKDLSGGNAAYGVLFGTIFVGLASGMFLGPRLFRGFSRRRLVGLAIVGAGIALGLDAVSPNLAIAIVFTAVLGFFAGVVWVVSLTLVGSGVADDMRGRTFAFIYNLMRVVLLIMVALTPFVAGLIGRHRLHIYGFNIRADGVTVALFGAGVISIVIGIICFRLMNDLPGVGLWGEVRSTFRRGVHLAGVAGERGLFIALEGGEGAGKSTQQRMLVEWLQARGHSDVVMTHEPGGTAVGQQLRAILLDPASAGLPPRAETLLYAADRAAHVAQVIRPALDRGAVVVTDRFVDSSLAYQGAGRHLEEEEVERLSRWATGGLVPHLTVVLDIDPRVGLQRAAGRSASADRLEAEAVDFHDRVRDGFRSLARHEPRRYLVVDATLPAEEIQERIRNRLERLLGPAPETVPAGDASYVAG